MAHHTNHDWHGMKDMSGFRGMQIFFIPIPMAMFGMCVAFMFGATIGLLMGKKHGMAMHGGPWMHHKGWDRRMGMGMGMGWKRWGGMGHHHHGFGAPACWEQHDGERGAEPDAGQAPEMAPAEE